MKLFFVSITNLMLILQEKKRMTLLFFSIFSIIIYTLRTIFFGIGFKKGMIDTPQIPIEELPFISIIVPARNEEKNIKRCINSLTKLKYPPELMEIIIVNDRSTDKTEKYIKKKVKKNKNIKLISIYNDDEKEIPGKPGALDIGIKSSIGKYILMTDADCKVNKNWARTIVEHFIKSDSSLISSFTLVAHSNFFDKYQAVEWLFTHTMACGGVGMNTALGCYGNNLSIKKSVYEEIGGYKKIPFSVTEDLALQQAVYNYDGKVDYICDKKATVRTKPLSTFNDYLKQRHRWAVGGKKLGWKATIFVLTSLLIWVALLLSIISGNLLLALIIFSSKILGDSFLVFSSMKIVKEKGLVINILPSLFIFFIMELIVPMLLLKKKVNWKGQTF